MKILVVGGAGYIGSHVCKALLENGDEVVVYDNLSTGLRENIQKGSEFVEGDVLNRDKLEKVCSDHRFEGLVYLAAFKAAGESMEVPEKYTINNITGTLNMIHTAIWAKIPYFVFSSSAAVYGEPEYLPLDEKHPTNPENYYGFTKLEIERFLGWYDQLKGLKFAALRYFNAAGYAPDGSLTGLERNPQNLLPVVLETACGMRDNMKVFGGDYDTPDGTCLRDYIHVSDLASAHVLALKRLAKTNTSFTVNLGSEDGVSVLEVINMAKKITGKDIPYEIVGRRAGDPVKMSATSKTAMEMLGWKAMHSDLETLVKSTWEAYQANGNQ
ncbi:MAG: UDP-glucose 4-epimerase GalE [Fibrobacteria bacterium]|nr:UDP-glucose 4-epimerase GalE [Fibrobacteria bacterium]